MPELGAHLFSDLQKQLRSFSYLWKGTFRMPEPDLQKQLALVEKRLPELNIHHLLSDLQKRVALVEKRLPQLERVAPAVNTPALNELRYAFVHLLRCLCDHPEPEQELMNAFKHAKRAHYDCADAEALYYFREFGLFEEKFRDINLLEHIPEFLEWGGSFHDLRDVMQEVSKETRDEYCDALEERLINIRPLHNKMRIARVELAKYVDDMQEKNKRLQEENHRISQQEERAREQLSIQRRQLRVACIAALIALCALGANVWLSSTKDVAATEPTPRVQIQPPR